MQNYASVCRAKIIFTLDFPVIYVIYTEHRIHKGRAQGQKENCCKKNFPFRIVFRSAEKFVVFTCSFYHT